MIQISFRFQSIYQSILN